MWKNLSEILIKENDGKKFRCNYNEKYAYTVKYDKECNNVCLYNQNNERLYLNNVILGWKYKEVIKESEWVNKDCTQDTYTIINDGSIIKFKGSSQSLIKSMNCFSTKEKADEVAKEQFLYRFMKKFRDENDEKVDWMNEHRKGYFIYKDLNNKKYCIDFYRHSRDIHTIYFTSLDLAQKCLKEMKEQGLL